MLEGSQKNELIFKIQLLVEKITIQAVQSDIAVVSFL